MKEPIEKPLEKVSGLEVRGLFGRFHHKVALNNLQDLTIITAPNGYGKTVLLRILDSFFNKRLSGFSRIPFSEIIISFESGKRVSIYKDTDSLFGGDGGERPRVVVKSHGFGGDEASYEVRPKAARGTLAALERYLPLDRVGPQTWVDYSTGESLSTSEVMERYADQLPDSFSDVQDPPSWLKNAMECARTHLVETQRLLSLDEVEDERYYPKRGRRKPSSVVEKDAIDLAERIKTVLTRYADESQKLDESFPKRIINVFSRNVGGVEHSEIVDESQIREQLANLSARRDDLVKAGLIGESISEPIHPGDILQEDTLRRFLSVYVDDTEKKLAIFDNIHERIRLFKQILNEHFFFKSVEVDVDRGIVVLDIDTKSPIPLSELSSGEQHELVLIYELLFKVQEGSLILIDEPELSLHVGWQKKFISDIQKIQSLRRLTVLIATHSPQIINDKWDLVHELATTRA